MPKPGRLHELCKSDQRYFDRWERIESERQSEGLGDTIEKVLGKVGRSFKRTYRRLFRRECGCNSRKAKANRMVNYKRLLKWWHGDKVK